MLMWFVNIDHWTLKLAYLTLQKKTDNPTEKINQVDISIFFQGRVISSISTVDWIHTINLIYNGGFIYLLIDLQRC